MNITTGCPKCTKMLTIDLSHKEPFIPPGAQATVALAVCEHCREKIRIEMLIKPEKENK